MPTPIVVTARLRPFVPREKGQSAILTMDGNTVTLALPKDYEGKGEHEQSKNYAVDFAFDSSIDVSHPDYATQEVVYNKFGRGLLDHALEGFNSTVFAYGQTGTGKTTTIMGDFEPVSQQGILLRLVHDLFEEAERLSSAGCKCECHARMLEIYNEKIQDLLTHEKGKEHLEIHMHPELGVTVPHLTVTAISSFNDCAKLINYGNTMKTVAATAMNARSSRGHTIFALKLEKNEGEAETIVSELYFVDLAGRENEKTTSATGERLVELSFINKSLFYLSTCIKLLGEKPHHAPAREKTMAAPTTPEKTLQREKTLAQTQPARKKAPAINSAFRNSKLTLLLAQALTGNSKTAMIGTLSPAAINYDENLSTLNFASTVKNIKLSATQVSVNKGDVTATLKAEILALKKQLAGGGGDASGVSGVDNSELEKQLAAVQALAEQYQKSFEDSKVEAEKAAAERDTVLSELGVSRNLELPHLRNQSDDPALDGTVLYHIPLGSEYSLGTSADNDIVMTGLGIAPRNCYLRNGAGHVYIRLVGADMKTHQQPYVEINKQPIEGMEAIAVKHHDRIVFGRSRVFFAITEVGGPPPPHAANEEEQIEENLMSHEELTNFLGKQGIKHEGVERSLEYLEHLRTVHLDSKGEIALEIFMKQAGHAKILLDEANEITDAVRPHDLIHFELTTLSPFLATGYPPNNLPALGVRMVNKLTRAQKLWHTVRHSKKHLSNGIGGVILMLTNPANLAFNRQMSILDDNAKADDTAAHSMYKYKELSVWSFECFQNRLDQMREVYQSWASDKKGFHIDPNLDPWKETGPAEIASLLQGQRSAIESWQCQWKEVSEKNSELEAKLASSEAEKKEAQERDEMIASLKDNLIEAEKKSALAVEQADRKDVTHAAAIKEYDETIASLKEDLKHAKKKSALAVIQDHHKADELASLNDELKESQKKFASVVEQADQKADTHAATIKERDDTIASLKDEVEKMKMKMEEMEKANRGLNKLPSMLQQEQERVEQETEKVQKAMSEANDMQAELSKCKEDIKKLQSENRIIKQERTHLQRKVRELEDVKSEMSSAAASMNEQMASTSLDQDRIRRCIEMSEANQGLLRSMWKELKQ